MGKHEKAKLMILLQMRGKCAEYEHKLQKFESLSLGNHGSLFKSMEHALHSMDTDLQKWVTEMGGLIHEWKENHEEAR